MDRIDSALADLNLQGAPQTVLRTTPWTLVTRVGTSESSVVVKEYTDDHAGLTRSQIARKVVLMARVAGAIDVRVPRALRTIDDPARPAVLWEDHADVGDWTSEARNSAAGALAALHRVDHSALPDELRRLLGATEPNRARVKIGVQLALEERLRAGASIPAWIEEVAATPEPLAEHNTVVHGDYFRSNLLVDSDQRVVAIDWDLVGFGDPMWDLAFLTNAEPGVSRCAQAAAIAAYGEISAAAAERLDWHRQCWRAFWWLRR